MAEPAIDPQESEAADNVVQMPGTETGLGLARKAEGGLTFRFAVDLPKVPSVLTVQHWTHQQMINGALIAVVALLALFIAYDQVFAGGAALPVVEPEVAAGPLRPNVETEFNPTIDTPVIGAGTYIDRLASVIGNVTLGAHIFVAPFASIRGDEGQPIVIRDGANVQDGVVIHALETLKSGKPVDKNLVTVDGEKYAVFIGEGVSLAHQSQVHGPAAVGDHTFVGMQALVFKATVGRNVVIEPGAKVIGVNIPEGRYVPAGSVVATQEVADALPKITDAYPFAKLNAGVLEVNEAFADKYLEMETGGAAGHEPAAPGAAAPEPAAPKPVAGGH
ncbi:MAG: carbonic anhydrase [Dehalococcoidia bacterium]